MRAQTQTSCQFAALDNFIASEPLMEALAVAARRLWARAGGERASAKSFWVDIDEEPSHPLAVFALAVARYHGFHDDALGCEVWVQRRVHQPGCVAPPRSRGLEFHFDKDETSAGAGGARWHHPALATATYLGDGGGAPLVVFGTRAGAAGAPRNAWVCTPARGRHAAFTGDALHGVPAELDGGGRYDRLSVLVNVWTARRPAGLARLPEDGARLAPTEGGVVGDRASAAAPRRVCRRVPRNGGPDALLLSEHRKGDTGSIPMTPLEDMLARRGVLKVGYRGGPPASHS